MNNFESNLYFCSHIIDLSWKIIRLEVISSKFIGQKPKKLVLIMRVTQHLVCNHIDLKCVLITNTKKVQKRRIFLPGQNDILKKTIMANYFLLNQWNNNCKKKTDMTFDHPQQCFAIIFRPMWSISKNSEWVLFSSRKIQQHFS